jgi:diguanylate cyclase (GGDEF)-like protein
MLLTEDNTLEIKTAYPRGQGIEGMVFKLGEGAAGHAGETLAPVYIKDIQKEHPRYQVRVASGPPKGCLLCIPMVHKGALLGVLNLERPEPDAFTNEEQELLRAVADLVAVAAKNTLLHEETVALSLTDPLTGASNRRHLFHRLEREVERAQRFDTGLSVLMVDIDHFKQLNDAAGHRAGDEALRKVSDLLRAQVRKLDTVARYGGEEFMILLPGVGRPEALEVAEKLRRSVEETLFEHGATQPLGKVTVSIGASSMPADAKSVETLVDCADSALYACKRGGRNKAISYEPGMELHPGRERGPHAAKRRRTQEIPAAKSGN